MTCGIKSARRKERDAGFCSGRALSAMLKNFACSETSRCICRARTVPHMAHGMRTACARSCAHGSRSSRRAPQRSSERGEVSGAGRRRDASHLAVRLRAALALILQPLVLVVYESATVQHSAPVVSAAFENVLLRLPLFRRAVWNALVPCGWVGGGQRAAAGGARSDANVCRRVSPAPNQPPPSLLIITREYPPALLILQGNTLLPF